MLWRTRFGLAALLAGSFSTLNPAKAQEFSPLPATAVEQANDTYVDQRVQPVSSYETFQAAQRPGPMLASPPPSPDSDRIAALEKKVQELSAPPKPTYPFVKVNGVFQTDTGWFSQDADSRAQFGRIQDGTDFRRARLSASGAVTETVNYFMQMDFAFIGRPTFTDVWVEQTDLPVFGTVRIGQWKQPFSLEVVSSFRYTTFVERSLIFQPFTPFRHTGIGFYRPINESLDGTIAMSGFRSGQDQFGDSISTVQGWATAERGTWCPWYDEPSGGRHYLHLGAGHYFSAPQNRTVNFRTIPEAFIGENAPGAVGTAGQAIPGVINGTPFFVATGPLNVHHFNVIGSEFLWVNGPLSVQAEGTVNFVNRINGPDVAFAGGYAQAGYFLTGEHRPYDRKTATIDRVKPFSNFFCVRTRDGICSGPGAWEVAGRVSSINLNDNGVNGGALTDFTAGINWFWNPNTKLVFNYVNAQLAAPAAHSVTNIFITRAQVDF